jgi:ankyrin repeat protein
MTELHPATGFGDMRAITKLATRAELNNASNSVGMTPLAVAALNGKTETVKALASLGAFVMAPAEHGVSPVEFAACRVTWQW